MCFAVSALIHSKQHVTKKNTPPLYINVSINCVLYFFQLLIFLEGLPSTSADVSIHPEIIVSNFLFYFQREEEKNGMSVANNNIKEDEVGVTFDYRPADRFRTIEAPPLLLQKKN